MNLESETALPYIPNDRRRRWLIHWILALTGLALSLQGAEQVPTSADPFSSNRVLQVEITMAPADWDKLSRQERDMTAQLGRERLNTTVPKPYTWFTAKVTIDGQTFQKVGVRKRGFYGSSDRNRPALNLDLDRELKQQNFQGRKSLKLHNNKQDGTNARQLMSYQLFAAAGVPAPRCNLAEVTVNGKKLGIYTHLEGIDDDFLQRKFGNKNGNLYEAQISDFRAEWLITFEKKNNPAATNRSDLNAVVEALKATDAELLGRVGAVVDLDSFFSFWAIESLINHWDGFSGDLNNCFLYHNPASKKLHFIPWGADATFGPHHVFVPFEPPASVWAVSYLTRRLYNHPEGGARYRKRLQELLNTVWDEKSLLAEFNRIQKQAEGLSTVPAFQSGPELEQMREFIRTRRSMVQAELNRPIQPWNFPMRREIYGVTLGTLTADFSTAWVPSPFTPAPSGAKAAVKLDFYGRQWSAEFTEVKAVPDLKDPSKIALSFSGRIAGVELPISFWVAVKTNLFRSGQAVDDAETSLLLVAGDWGRPDFRLLAFGEGGTTTIKLEEASTQPGGKVRGQIKASLTSTPWEKFDLTQLRKARR